MNTKTSPKNRFEWIAFLYALLEQFAKLNGYMFQISAGGFPDKPGKIYVGLKYEESEQYDIEIDLDGITDDSLQDIFNAVRNKIVCYTKPRD